jgi:1-acyl-sn-glycerol-3-phosphate acyltransferase
MVTRDDGNELAGGLIGGASPEPTLAYRALRRVWHLGAALLRFRVQLEGLEQLAALPAPGGWIAAGMPHRTWIDPFLLWGWLPARPRLVFFGDAATMSRSVVRRAFVRAVGGIIPIPTRHAPGAVAVHLEAAARALEAGTVFCLFPETGPASEPGRIRRLGGGVAYIALRSGAPIVPIAIGGNDELFIGRRIVVRVLSPLDPRELAGLPPGAPAPAPGSPEERDAAHRLLAALAEAVAEPVAAAHRAAAPAPGTPKRGRRLTTIFR